MYNSTLYDSEEFIDWYPIANGACPVFRIFGVWISIIIFFGIILNGYVLYLFSYHRDLRSVSNGFVLSISICDLLSCILGMPLPMIANTLCRWPFGKIGCYYEAFITYFVSAASMYILTLFSVDRYVAVSMPHQHKRITPKLQIAGVIICYALGFLLASMPVVGWSYYAMEGAGTSCSIKWQDKSTNVVSYNIFIFIILVLLPLAIMGFTNYSVYKKIRHVARRGFLNVNDPRNRRKLQVEKKVLKTSFFMIIGFLFTWTPYIVVSVISAFGDPDTVSPIGATMPALFAKAQVLWNPLIYVVTNKNFQSKFPFLKVPLPDEMQMTPYACDS